jgi:hypothetical protein
MSLSGKPFRPSSSKLAAAVNPRWKCDQCGKNFAADALAKNEIQLVAGRMVCLQCNSDAASALARAAASRRAWQWRISGALSLAALFFVFPQPAYTLAGFASLLGLFLGILAVEWQVRWRALSVAAGVVFAVLSICGMAASSNKSGELERDRMVRAAYDEFAQAIAERDLIKAQYRLEVMQRGALNPLGEYFSPQMRQMVEDAEKSLSVAIGKECPLASEEERSAWLQLVNLYPEKTRDGEFRLRAVKMQADIMDLELNISEDRNTSGTILDALAVEARCKTTDLFKYYTTINTIRINFVSGNTKTVFKTGRAALTANSGPQPDGLPDFKQFLVQE